MKTIKVTWTRHAGHCWSKDELISDVFLWAPSYGWAKAECPARNYIQQLCADKYVALKTYRMQWTIEKGGEKKSGISVLMARYDDDNDDMFIYVVFKSYMERTNAQHDSPPTTTILIVVIVVGNRHGDTTSNPGRDWLHFT